MAMHKQVTDQLNMPEEQLVAYLTQDLRTLLEKLAGVAHAVHAPLVIDPTRTFQDCITAMIGMTGTCTGLLSIHLPEQVAVDITTRMLGIKPWQASFDVNDAIGELASIFAGSFKEHLANHGSSTRLSLPSVLVGGEMFMKRKSFEDSLTILCDVEDDWLMVNLMIDTPPQHVS